jgi:hypothetical protein
MSAECYRALSGIRGHFDIEVTHQHFIRGLFTPVDLLSSIGVVRIVRRIVVVRDHLDLRTFLQVDRLLQLVGDLPVEIVAGNAQHCFRCSIGAHNAVLERFAAQMRMRSHIEKVAVIRRRRHGFQSRARCAVVSGT